MVSGLELADPGELVLCLALISTQCVVTPFWMGEASYEFIKEWINGYCGDMLIAFLVSRPVKKGPSLLALMRE